MVIRQRPALASVAKTQPLLLEAVAFSDSIFYGVAGLGVGFTFAFALPPPESTMMRALL